jgi:REP element-mobilizing transposase RayT
LPGDARGWVEFRHGWHLPDAIKELESKAKMSEDACTLTPAQRKAVEDQIAETCRIRGWILHAVNCRTNHVHVVVTAPVHAKIVRAQLKAWATRKLKKFGTRQNWWAERGSQRWLNTNDDLESATYYVKDGQDGPR